MEEAVLGPVLARQRQEGRGETVVRLRCLVPGTPSKPRGDRPSVAGKRRRVPHCHGEYPPLSRFGIGFFLPSHRVAHPNVPACVGETTKPDPPCAGQGAPVSHAHDDLDSGGIVLKPARRVNVLYRRPDQRSCYRRVGKVGPRCGELETPISQAHHASLQIRNAATTTWRCAILGD